MTLVIVALVVLLIVALLFWALVRGQRKTVVSLDDLAGLTQAVDLAAFRNLVDPAETGFLKQTLPPAHFRMVQHERTLAAIEYVKKIAHNAGLLASLGQAARANPDPQLAKAALAMTERAFHVRTLAILVLMKLYARSILPGLPFAAEDIFRDYHSLTESAIFFTRLQRPSFAGRVGAML